jgi:[ribosomal protein S5]-alanine N-acetyltransferase
VSEPTDLDEPLAPLETARLWLSVPPAAHADRVLAFDLRNREHLGPWAPPRPTPLDTVEAWRERLLVDRQRARDGTAFLWRLRATDDRDGAVLGTVSFTRIERGPLERASLGASVDVDEVGRGLAHEAVDAALDFAANVLHLRFVEAGHAPQNLRSASTLRRLGFVPYGYARDYLHVGGRLQDHVLLQYDLRPRRR